MENTRELPAMIAPSEDVGKKKSQAKPKASPMTIGAQAPRREGRTSIRRSLMRPARKGLLLTAETTMRIPNATTSHPATRVATN